MKQKVVRRLAVKCGGTVHLPVHGGIMRIEFYTEADGQRFTERLEKRCPEADGTLSGKPGRRVMVDLEIDSLKRRSR